MPSRVRAFVGFGVPPDAVVELRRRQERLRRACAGGDIGWCDPANFHLTLVFLGALDGPALGEAQRVLRAVAPARGWCRLSLGVDDAFPRPLNPKVLVTRVEDAGGDLDRLHRALVEAYAPLGYRPNHPVFRPHVTLGHVHGSVRLPPRADRAAGDAAPWVADRISLYVGLYTEAGLRYHPVDTRPLRVGG